jgi:hypothetical protein
MLTAGPRYMDIAHTNLKIINKKIQNKTESAQTNRSRYEHESWPTSHNWRKY